MPLVDVNFDSKFIFLVTTFQNQVINNSITISFAENTFHQNQKMISKVKAVVSGWFLLPLSRVHNLRFKIPFYSFNIQIWFLQKQDLSFPSNLIYFIKRCYQNSPINTQVRSILNINNSPSLQNPSNQEIQAFQHINHEKQQQQQEKHEDEFGTREW